MGSRPEDRFVYDGERQRNRKGEEDGIPVDPGRYGIQRFEHKPGRVLDEDQVRAVFFSEGSVCDVVEQVIVPVQVKNIRKETGQYGQENRYGQADGK